MTNKPLLKRENPELYARLVAKRRDAKVGTMKENLKKSHSRLLTEMKERLATGNNKTRIEEHIAQEEARLEFINYCKAAINNVLNTSYTRLTFGRMCKLLLKYFGTVESNPVTTEGSLLGYNHVINVNGRFAYVYGYVELIENMSVANMLFLEFTFKEVHPITTIKYE